MHWCSPLAACIVLSKAMRAILQGGGFQVSSSSIAPNPLSKVCPVFSNRVLPSGSGKQSRVLAIACVIWGVSWTTLANNSKEGLLCLVLFLDMQPSSFHMNSCRGIMYVFCQQIVRLIWFSQVFYPSKPLFLSPFSLHIFSMPSPFNVSPFSHFSLDNASLLSPHFS